MSEGTGTKLPIKVGELLVYDGSGIHAAGGSQDPLFGKHQDPHIHVISKSVSEARLAGPRSL
jgi:hypothetical protein